MKRLSVRIAERLSISAVVGRISGGNEAVYRELVSQFVVCEQSPHLEQDGDDRN